MPSAHSLRNRPLAAELRDAVTPRALLLVVGVLLLQLGFLLSYLGAFHDPGPRGIPVAVVAPAQVADRLDALPGDPVDTTRVRNAAEARARIVQRDAQAAYLTAPRGTEDTLLVASGAGSAVTDAVTGIGERFARQQDRTLRTEDIAPAGAEDRGSLSAFYLVVGWMVGGYLAAAMLGVTAGARPANRRRASFRLAAMAVYAAVSGLGGAVIAGPVLGALDGHLFALWGLGTLVVFAAGAVTLALQVMFGVLGVGLAILIFVVLGNPSAGGAYQYHLLPAFWGAMGPWLPTGAGVAAARNIVYFAGHALAVPLWVLAGWALAGLAATLLFAGRRRDPDARAPGGGTGLPF